MRMKLAEIAHALGCELRGDGDVDIVGVAPLETAEPGTLTFLADRRLAPELKRTRASAVVLPPEAPDVPLASLRAPHPYAAFVAALELLHPPRPRPAAGIHPTAVVAASATLGPGAVVGPCVVVGERVTIGRDALLHAHVTIYEGARIGDAFTAHAGAVVREDVRIGSRVTLHAGAVIGSDGFGYLPLAEGNRKIPQIGTVVLEDDVEIGANTTVDRAALGVTVVGRGTKLDNLVMVGHGCRIGPHCLVAGQAGLSGGTTLGARVMMGGQAGAAGHFTIGDGAQIGAQAGMHRDIPAGGVYSGYPAMEARRWRRVTMSMPRLPEVFRRLRRVERVLGIGGAREEDEGETR
jgi:UDP-3-O-[3-hydroxymyristoyl] glucosamine N-acyltransferase